MALPIFASRGDDPDALRRGVRLANQLTMVVNVPAMVGLIVLAEPIILVLFGEQWRPAAPLLSILAVAGILYPLHIINLQLLLALGDSGRFLRLEVAKKLVGVVFVAVGSWFGMRGLAWAQALFSLVALLINARPTAQSLGYGMLRQLGDLLGIFAAAGAMAAVLLLLAPLFGLGPAATLAVMVPAGVAVYVASGLLMNVSAFREARQIVGAALIARTAGAPGA